MDLLLKYAIRCEYNNLISFIKSHKQFQFVNIFLCIVFIAINNLITDKHFFTLILLFTNCDIEIYDIGTIYYIIYLLEKLNDNYKLSKSYIIKLLMYDTKKIQLTKSIYILKKSPFIKSCNSISGVDIINDATTILTKISNYMSSHKISIYSNSIYPIIDEKYKYIQEAEIFNRLVALKNVLSMGILKYCGVNVISYDKFMEFNHGEKYGYYVSCVNKVNYTINKMLNILNTYVKLNSEINHCNGTIKKILEC